MNVNILVDSCCTLEESFFEEREYIKRIGIPVQLEKYGYEDIKGKRKYSKKDFYNKLRSGKNASTSLINVARFIKTFKELSDKPTYYIGFSSGMSGTFNNAVLAREELDEESRKNVFVIDSLCASVSYGALIHRLDFELKNNPDLDIVKFVEEYRHKIKVVFSVDDLMYLKKGGRIPPALAALGTVINLKPVMKMDTEGKLCSYKKVRGRHKVLKTMKNFFEDNYTASYQHVFFAHGDVVEEIEELMSEVRSLNSEPEFHVTYEGETIGSHVGPGLLVMAFFGDER